MKVIDTSEARRHSGDLGEVLTRTEGISVQRTGGLGSDTKLSLHGLSDDQVRIFIDGVPLELSGFGTGVSNVPVGWLDRVEVYRGVVPLRLGTDALGGALDLITERIAAGSAASASYSAGSFDTHQLGLSARYRPARSRLVVRAASFYDRSANDYRIDVKVPDALGRLSTARVRRFHDAYRGGGGMLETGVVGVPWARRLLLRVFVTDFEKELQHNINMTVPYGRPTYGQTAAGGTLRYEQPNIAGTRVSVTALLGYGHRRLDFVDTSRWVHDWFGRRVFERTEGSGELSAFATDLTQRESRVLARSTVSYDIAPGHVARWVIAPDFSHRTGEERLRVDPSRIDPLTTRRSLFQVVSGLEYAAEDALDRVQNSLFGKYYLYRPAADQVQTFDNSVRHLESLSHHAGVGDALRGRLTSWLMAKLSYEYATRLPRGDEVFGDGIIVLPNLELRPETSHNANAGLLLERESPRGYGRWSFEATGFVRHSENMIVRLLAADRIHSLHQNVFTVRTTGIDGLLAWASAQRWLTVRTNATWQDQRNAADRGPFAPFRGQRIPNRPWLFANASASLRIPGLAAHGDALSLTWSTRYVHGFYPGWAERSGDASSAVPTQVTHALGLVYSVVGDNTIDFALDVLNLTDARVYDVLGVQRPGRAVFAKCVVGRAGRSQSEKGQ